MTGGPDGLDPTIQSREIVFDAEVDLVSPFLHRRKPHQGSATKR